MDRPTIVNSEIFPALDTSKKFGIASGTMCLRKTGFIFG